MIFRLFVRRSGYTLFEGILVLLAISILAAVAIGANVRLNDYDRQAELTVAGNHLRYAQSRAMANNGPWGIHFQPPATYWLFENNNGTRRMLPGATADTITLNALTLSGAALTITFDGYGAPLGGASTVNTSAGPIVVTANTGYIVD